MVVAGGIKIGTHTTCAGGGANNGTIEYDNTIKKMQLCVDGVWKGASSIDKLDDVGDVTVTGTAGSLRTTTMSWPGMGRTTAGPRKTSTASGSAIAIPGGADKQVQFNDNVTRSRCFTVLLGQGQEPPGHRDSDPRMQRRC